MEDKIFPLLGLGVPFYLAAATYAVFAWLDNNASDEVTQIISSWLHGRSQNKPDLGNLIIQAFDRIYTSPLFSLRAFCRSAAISTVVWLLLFFVPWAALDFTVQRPAILLKEFGLIWFFIVLSDYMSLFFVRFFLIWARTWPVITSVLSSYIGIAAVIGGSLLLFQIRLDWFSPKDKIDWAALYGADLYQLAQRGNMDDVRQLVHQTLERTIAPGLIIHLWL